jgi:hypothetical protein
MNTALAPIEYRHAVLASRPCSMSQPAAPTMSEVAKMRPRFQHTPCTPIHPACCFLSSEVM